MAMGSYCIKQHGAISVTGTVWNSLCAECLSGWIKPLSCLSPCLFYQYTYTVVLSRLSLSDWQWMWPIINNTIGVRLISQLGEQLELPFTSGLLNCMIFKTQDSWRLQCARELHLLRRLTTELALNRNGTPLIIGDWRLTFVYICCFDDSMESLVLAINYN